VSHSRLLILLSILPVIVIGFFVAPGAPAQTKFKTLHTFTLGPDGYNPHASLIFDQAGNLYGTTELGGYYSDGTVFELTPGADGRWKEILLHTFGADDGAMPLAGLIFDQAGNLYGTTSQGGSENGGGVFKLAPNSDGSWTETVLHAFCSLDKCRDGAKPWASLIFDQAGNLYGTTVQGGPSSECTYGCGTVFKLTPNQDGSWTESVVHNFNGGDGAQPSASVIFDQAGNLYGTTAEGGSQDSGVVFKLAPNQDGSWRQSVLRNFSSGNDHDCRFPLAGLIFDQAGNLYGTTENGGAYDSGVVFQLTPNSNGIWKEKVLITCSSENGMFPWAGLVFDQAGSLYGTTTEGGPANLGVAFKLAPNSNGGWDKTVLHAFRGHPEEHPYAGLTLDNAGNLYGTALGGDYSLGSVFEITP